MISPSPQPNFKLHDFREHAEGLNSMRSWLASSTVSTPLGSFSVEITATPDDELVALANVVVALMLKEQQTILSLVYDRYQRAAEDHQWMKTHGVPIDLSRAEVVDYISDRFIRVRRHPTGRAMGSISMRVKWDVEHGVQFGLTDGRLVLK